MVKETVRLACVLSLIGLVGCDPDDAKGKLCGACYPWQECDGSDCRFNENSSWQVTAESGYVSGDIGDAFGNAPDPFVCVNSYGSEQCSSTAQDTYYPSWNEVLLSSIVASTLRTGIQVTYVDEDVSSNDVICTGTIFATEADFKAGGVLFTCADGSSVNLGLQANP